MQIRTLGRTSVRVSEIALGTWGLASGAYGEKAEPSRFESVVKAAWDAGVTTFDVAPLWGDGESEWRTAAALGDHLKDAVLVTRTGQAKMGDRLSGRFESQQIIDDVEASLKRLGRETIDVVLLHNPPMKVLQSDLYRKGVDHLLASGKVRAWGASVVTAEEGRAALEVGAQAIGIAHHALDPHVLHDLTSTMKHYGAAGIARSPLCYGLLAGRWTSETKFGEHDHRSRRWDATSFAERLRQVEELRFLVRDDVPDLATAAMRFVLSSPFVATACVGARSVEQITSAAGASREKPLLPPEDLKRVASVWNGGAGVFGGGIAKK
ncbi:aldo/keto reductase [Sandaracinus amylolyticus]|uniref:Aldo/keto reductase n=1 Tax=Sandaracinus amylolyticus TaxID=927083 RepID=A0A0F6SHW5_9BACT|nr:aldo/keto reductase [Sandaracinus amylolyticus]AKF11154.1 aldo/keto reductase [Sandaracinus amylolyticus]